MMPKFADLSQSNYFDSSIERKSRYRKFLEHRVRRRLRDDLRREVTAALIPEPEPEVYPTRYYVGMYDDFDYPCYDIDNPSLPNPPPLYIECSGTVAYIPPGVDPTWCPICGVGHHDEFAVFQDDLNGGENCL